MTGTRGPVPKRSDQRRRANKETGEISAAPVGNGGVHGPDLDLPDAHPLAADWYEAIRQSGQARFLEPSDWAQARVWTEILSRALNLGAKPPAMLISAWASGAAELLTTEGARRRLRIELERNTEVDEDEEAAVIALDDYQKRLSG